VVSLLVPQEIIIPVKHRKRIPAKLKSLICIFILIVERITLQINGLLANIIPIQHPSYSNAERAKFILESFEGVHRKETTSKKYSVKESFKNR
jgi:hypothetical protein